MITINSDIFEPDFINNKQFKSILRSIKIDEILTPFEFDSKIKGYKYRNIKLLSKLNNIQDYIVTGSLALSLYNIIDRQPNDIDIISTYNQNRIKNRLVKTHIVSNLESIPFNIIYFNDIEVKVAIISYIIEHKYHIRTYKHNIDILNIFSKIEKRSLN